MLYCGKTACKMNNNIKIIHIHTFQHRYNMERLSNHMNRVVRLTNWNQPIAEGYFPKLDNVLANRVWPSRPVNSVLTVIF